MGFHNRAALIVIASVLAVLGFIGLAQAQMTGPAAASATLSICTDTTWQEPSTGQPAVLTANGPTPGSVHDIPGALPIWGQDGSANSETTLVKSFTLPGSAQNITGMAQFVADDGVVFHVNGVEAGRFDAMVWPPPTTAEVNNLHPGQNTITANVYNRPSWAWFEACLTITYDGGEAAGAYLPALFHRPEQPQGTATPTATITATPTTTPTATPTQPATANLLLGNMPLPTGWHTDGPDTYWEGFLRVENEVSIEIRILNCGDDSGNERLDVLQVYDPQNNLVFNQPNCAGDRVFTISTAGKPGLYRVFMQDNDTTNGNGGNIWVNRLRDQRVYTEPTNPVLAATNLLTETQPLPTGWVTGGTQTFWEGYIRVQNEAALDLRATDCGDDEGNGTLDGIQITDPTGLIVGEVSGCNSSSRTFHIVTAGQPGWYRIYFFDKDTGPNPGRSATQNGGGLSVDGLIDQHVYPTPSDSPPPAVWSPVSPGSAAGGGISATAGASQSAAIAAGPGGDLYVAWSDNSSGDAEIYLRRWDGANWSELGGSATGGGISDNDGESLSPTVAVGANGGPWVAWHDTSNGQGEIYVRRWSGSAWESVGNGSAAGGGISNTVGASEYVDLQVGGNNNAVAAWVDDSAGNAEVYVRRWNGQSWVELAESGSGGGVSVSNGRSGRPALALNASGQPVVAWAETSGNNQDIYVLAYDSAAWVEVGDGSATGGGISRTPGKSQYATMTISPEGNVTVVWYDDSSGNWEIYAATLSGGEWVAAGNGAMAGGGVSQTSGPSREPSLVTDAAGAPIVAWQETTGNNEIYVRRLSGESWVAAGAGAASGGGISANSGDSNFPVLAAAADNQLYLAWEDNSSGNYEIYVVMSEGW